MLHSRLRMSPAGKGRIAAPSEFLAHTKEVHSHITQSVDAATFTRRATSTRHPTSRRTNRGR